MENLNRIETFKDFVGELKVTYRRTAEPITKITNSKQVIDFMRPIYDECMDDHEELKIIHLNSNNIVNVDHHTSGTEAVAVASIKMILQKAILIKTSSIIMIHNHPSGNLKPSQADIQLSKKLKEACKLMDLMFLDSLIITRESYYSFAEEGLL